MNPRSEARSWQFGPTAVTLLVAYLLVLQGLAVGVSSGVRGAGLFADAICLSKSSGPLDNNPAAPARHSRHDGCCVFHSASPGGAATPSPFVGEPPPSLSYIEIKLAFDGTQLRSDAATPPLGSRAPPALI